MRNCGNLLLTSVILLVSIDVGLHGKADPVQLEQIYDSHRTSSSPVADLSDGHTPRPSFITSHSGNVTAIYGKPARLNCRVENVGNKTVSWIRHSDTHLLTAGRYTYTSDERFKAIHKVMSQDYLLQILPVKPEDNGLYECQVSTTPVMSHYVYLQVAEPHTEILGGPNIFIEEGFSMNLTCVVKDSPEPPQYIFWYRDKQPLSYSSPRGGVSQVTEKGVVTSSYLLLDQARVTDSGQYACHSSVGRVANVTVHIIRSADPEKWLPNLAPRVKTYLISSKLSQLFFAVWIFVQRFPHFI